LPLKEVRQEKQRGYLNQCTVGYLGNLSGQKSIFEKSTEVEHKVTRQRRTMSEQKATLTEPLRATPPPYG